MIDFIDSNDSKFKDIYKGLLQHYQDMNYEKSVQILVISNLLSNRQKFTDLCEKIMPTEGNLPDPQQE